ncbi:TetR family transcriptional regulator [Paenibacillus sp. LMG 31459]|uniref:TetR family transcriptional regulator n=1 Tax=Paenibacillus phytohabitans TaxID=2654978 RepID=A0ABX1Y9A5_9BACL|nr:TetR family transcriptional regulator [Paenibacillus phytohabitans]NOU77520.1 TetR family transcriptional regulator [Paenibacillus phytohabitans]
MSPRLTDHRKEQRSRQILDAAKSVFIRKGYGSVSLKDIIEETGMSRGWIYLYYQTKEEIFEALLDHQDLEYEQYLEYLTAASSPVWQIIVTLYTQQLHDLEQTEGGGMVPAFYEYFLVGWRDSSRREMLKQRYERGIVRFADLLRLGVSRGEFNPVMDLGQISRLVSSFQEGIVTHSITVGTRQAGTRLQFNALLNYLYSLLQPSAGKAKDFFDLGEELL